MQTIQYKNVELQIEIDAEDRQERCENVIEHLVKHYNNHTEKLGPGNKGMIVCNVNIDPKILALLLSVLHGTYPNHAITPKM